MLIIKWVQKIICSLSCFVPRDSLFADPVVLAPVCMSVVVESVKFEVKCKKSCKEEVTTAGNVIFVAKRLKSDIVFLECSIGG